MMHLIPALSKVYFDIICPSPPTKTLIHMKNGHKRCEKKRNRSNLQTISKYITKTEWGLKKQLTEIRHPRNCFQYKEPRVVTIMVQCIKYLNH